MAYISEEEINNIRNEANIVDIISSYIPLNKSGNDYVGMCPFHDDHRPSMHVSPKLNIFKCFVCNAGGNVFSFVQKFENVSYVDSIRIVAEKSGLAFNHTIKSSQPIKYKEEYAIMDLSLKFYQNNLATKNGIEAKKYLNNRGIDDKIIKDFKIGLSLDDNKLRDFLNAKKCDLNKANNVGLLNKNGIEYYDTFINRIMIPIFDMQGNLAGYTARAYLKDEKNKYINSKETIIYKKSNILFNYYNAKDASRLEKSMILVEGNMDAISMASYGIKNVCALMGVVISKFQIDTLKRLNIPIILMLDNDNAGKTATLSVGEDLVKEKIDTYVIRLSGAKDPDEYIHKYGVDKLKDVIKHAKKFLDFKFDTLKEDKDLNNIEELTIYIKEVLSSLKNASNLDKEIVISKIAKDYNISPSVIKEYLPKNEIVVEENKPINKSNVKQSRYSLAADKLLYAMLNNKKYYQIYLERLGYLKNKVERDITFMIGSYIKKYNNIEISGFLDYLNEHEDLLEHVNDILNKNYGESIDEKEFLDILDIVSKCIDEDEIKELKEKIKNEQDINKKMELIERLTELKKGCGDNERD